MKVYVVTESWNNYHDSTVFTSETEAKDRLNWLLERNEMSEEDRCLNIAKRIVYRKLGTVISLQQQEIY